MVCLPLDRGECAHLKVLLSSSFLQGPKAGVDGWANIMWIKELPRNRTCHRAMSWRRVQVVQAQRASSGVWVWFGPMSFA